MKQLNIILLLVFITMLALMGCTRHAMPKDPTPIVVSALKEARAAALRDRKTTSLIFERDGAATFYRIVQGSQIIHAKECVSVAYGFIPPVPDPVSFETDGQLLSERVINVIEQILPNPATRIMVDTNGQIDVKRNISIEQTNSAYAGSQRR
ncbi:MAG: hypothetical protein PHR77_15255 [Kiritimatiellae bacterium]|nr:hypothetical protein [Kiritimatiellia bacterium]MDD5523441.1 hypothetical protein [Kiritimatiellia bacterium]